MINNRKNVHINRPWSFIESAYLFSLLFSCKMEPLLAIFLSYSILLSRMHKQQSVYFNSSNTKTNTHLRIYKSDLKIYTIFPYSNLYQLSLQFPNILQLKWLLKKDKPIFIYLLQFERTFVKTFKFHVQSKVRLQTLMTKERGDYSIMLQHVSTPVLPIGLMVAFGYFVHVAVQLIFCKLLSLKVELEVRAVFASGDSSL